MERDKERKTSPQPSKQQPTQEIRVPWKTMSPSPPTSRVSSPEALHFASDSIPFPDANPLQRTHQAGHYEDVNLRPESSRSEQHSEAKPVFRGLLSQLRPSPFFQNQLQPQQPIQKPLTSSTDLPPRSQCVSFCDQDPLERSRRFTITSQPSYLNLQNAKAPSSVQIPTLPAAPSRKASLKGDAIPKPTRTNSVLSMASSKQVPQPAAHQYQTYEIPQSSQDRQADSKKPEFVDNKPSAQQPQAQKIDRPSFRFDKTKSPSPPLSQPPSLQRQVSEAKPIPIKSPGGNLLRSNSANRRSNKTIVASPVGPPVPFQEYLTKEDDRKFHILLACTGSVATIKVPMIIDKLFQIFGTNRISVQLVVTKAARHFLKGLKIHNDVKIWRDDDEWANFTEWNRSNTTTTVSTSELLLSAKKFKNPKNPFEKMILHNELRKWADIMLIAPLSANTLAKIANGITDNLLTSIIRCWGPTSGTAGQGSQKKPILVAPAMNTFMYTHPMTAKQLKLIASEEDSFGMEVLKPVEKVLVCGDIGMGGMREWVDIVEILRRKIKQVIAERSGEGIESSIGVHDEEDEEEDEEEDKTNNDDDDDDDYDDDDDDDDDEDDDEEGDDDDEGDDEGEDEGENKSSAERATGQHAKTPKEKDSGKKGILSKKDEDGLLFELSEDTPDVVDEIQRNISPPTEGAQSII